MLAESDGYDIWASTPNEIMDDIEVFTEYLIERESAWITENIGTPIMVKLIDCNQLKHDCIKRIMNIQIFYRGFLYKFQEFRIMSEMVSGQFQPIVYVALIFGQQTRMM